MTQSTLPTDEDAKAPRGAEEPDAVLDFWFGQLDEEGLAAKDAVKSWFTKDAEFDETIRSRFEGLHERLRANGHASWLRSARGRLATLIVLDQFSRNMYRDTPAMFATDDRALAVALEGIDSGMDRTLPLDQRVFCYMPLMHSEKLSVQDRCVEIFDRLQTKLDGRARERVAGNLKYAKMHRDIVKQFGRFPHRNALVGRDSTPEELAFLEQPGSSF